LTFEERNSSHAVCIIFVLFPYGINATLKISTSASEQRSITGFWEKAMDLDSGDVVVGNISGVSEAGGDCNPGVLPVSVVFLRRCFSNLK
jgi:hypothetical protein